MTSDDEQAFTAFVTNASPRLLVFAHLLMGDRGEAEDALQVALMRLTRTGTASSLLPRPTCVGRSSTLPAIVHGVATSFRC